MNIHDISFYRFVIRSLPIAVLTVDSGLRITSLNPWAEDITGYQEEEVMGRYCGDVLRGGRCRSTCPLQTVLGRQEPLVYVETTIQNKWMETIPVRVSTAGLLDDDGNLVGGLEAFQDISTLKVLERERDNVISMFAHDMKSPLIGIHGLAARILKTSPADPKTRIAVHTIVQEAKRLESLIDDFLEFSHIQTAKLPFNISATSLERELQELFEIYQPRAMSKGLTMEFHCEEPLPIVPADAASLHRAFRNLLDNALKYSKTGSTICIRPETTDTEVIVTISDGGVGIDPRDIPFIFDPFHRGRRTENREGFGMGLATVKAIVEGHRGRVLVKSELGRGSVFTVILPKQMTHPRDVFQPLVTHGKQT